MRGKGRHATRDASQGAFVPAPIELSQARTPPRLAPLPAVSRCVRARSRSRQRRGDSRSRARSVSRGRPRARSVSRGRPSARSVSPSTRTRPASETPVITTQLFRLITGIVDQKVKTFADEMRKQKEQEMERERCRDAFIDSKLVGLS